ncbi:MAG: hypothetical protein WBK97_08120 [Bacteroidales bacterium]|jgi:alkylhydroperoxidase/carboxymuconolactone decarboxylase family protein YurZ
MKTDNTSITKDWLKNKKEFLQFDVRPIKGNFLPAIIKKAKDVPLKGGITIIQNFEPIPLYETMRNLGFTYHTEKLDKDIYYAHFYREEIKEDDAQELPLKPIVMPRYADIDPAVAELTVNFWDHIWNKENPAIKLEYKLLLSLANAIGAGRMKQATRELIKAYHLGITTEEFDELFALFVWNQGIGHFSSEIAGSPLFKAYLLIKDLEKKNKTRSEITTALTEKFSERNPETGFNS